MIVTLLIHPRRRIPVGGGKWAPELNAVGEPIELRQTMASSPVVDDVIDDVPYLHERLVGYSAGIVRSRRWRDGALVIVVDTWELPSKDKP